MENIIVSTGDIKQDYQVLKPVHQFHLSQLDKEIFGKDLTFDGTIDALIEELKKKPKEAGGDAITFLRVEFEQLELRGTQYFVYGTMVKFK